VIAAAVVDGDARRAERLMQKHLLGLESQLAVDRRPPVFDGFEAVFGSGPAPASPTPAVARRRAPELLSKRQPR
jgi:hypothetical protein